MENFCLEGFFKINFYNKELTTSWKVHTEIQTGEDDKDTFFDI